MVLAWKKNTQEKNNGYIVLLAFKWNIHGWAGLIFHECSARRVALVIKKNPLDV
jgi:hypothetical protein